MTLIAATTNFGFPFLISDILISSNTQRKEIDVPTSSKLHEAINFKTYHPYGLTQKMYIINETTCVALAGNVAKMRQLLEEMKLRFAYYDILNQEVIQKFFEDISLTTFYHDVHFILIYKAEGNKIESTRWPQSKWISETHEFFENVYATGSGGKQFKEMFADISEQIMDLPQDSSLYKTIKSNLACFAKIFGEEYLYGSSLFNLWGAGFEGVIFDGKKFMKLEKMCYVIIPIDYKGENLSEPLPNVVMYYEYVDENLVITSLKLRTVPQQKMFSDFMIYEYDQICHVKRFVIQTLNPDENLDVGLANSDHSFKTGLVIKCFPLMLPNMPSFCPSFATHNRSFVDFDAKNSKLKIGFELNQLWDVQDKLRSHCENNGFPVSN